jgi:hypothetical protein
MSDNNCNTGQDLKSLRGKMPEAPIEVNDLCVKVGCDVFTCVKKVTKFEPKGKLSYTATTTYYDKFGEEIADAVETACPIKVEVLAPQVDPSTPPTACAPTISSAPADTLAGLLSGTSIGIQKPACCSLKVTTSAGEFIVTKDARAFGTDKFKCAVTVTKVEIVSGTCNLADVIVTTQFEG